jgi:hypothetical protein
MMRRARGRWSRKASGPVDERRMWISCVKRSGLKDVSVCSFLQREAIPVIWKLEPRNLRNDQGILQGQTLVGLIDAALEQPGAYDGLVLLVHTTVVFVRSTRGVWRGDEVLVRCLPPVLVDAVLELDDGEVADFEREGLVEEHRLACVSLREIGRVSVLLAWSRG